MKKEEDMSNTFVMEVGQKSAIAEDPLDEVSGFPDIKVDSPEVPSENLEQNSKKNDFASNDNSFNSNGKNEKKRSKWFLVTILLMILCLGIGIGITYFYLEVYRNTVTTTEEEQNDDSNAAIEEEISPTSLFVKELISNYDYETMSETEIFEVLYNKDKIYVKDLEESYLRALAVKKANQWVEGIGFSSEEFQDSVVMLFGSQVLLKDQDFSLRNACIEIQYDSQNKFYTAVETDGCGSTTVYSMQRKIIKAIKKENSMEINVAVAIINDNTKKIFRGYDSSLSENAGIDEVDGITKDTFDIDKDYSKLNQYKYTFNYDSDNNNYYLVSVELEK